MIVVDASVLANVLADDEADGDLARQHVLGAGDLVGPDLVDVETVSVLRKRWIAKDLTARRFHAAIDDLAALPLVRYPTRLLMARAYELRSTVTPYDAAYVALAETLDCLLVTTDRKLAKAHGPRCDIQIISS